MAWKLNFKQLLSKTLNSRINIIETTAVLKTENIQVVANSGFLKSCVFQKEKSMITFSANTSIDKKCLNLFEKRYFETSRQNCTLETH